MQVRYLVSLVASASVGSVFTLPTTLGINNLDVSGQNATILTSLYPNIPPKFNLIYDNEGRALDRETCALNAAKAILEMSLKNQWTRPIDRIETYDATLRPGRISDMRIEVVPGRDDFERRYAIWAVFISVAIMYFELTLVREMVTTIWYDGYDEGEIRFLNGYSGLSSDGGSGGTDGDSFPALVANNSSVINPCNTTGDLVVGDSECEVTFHYLDLRDPIFSEQHVLTVMSTLVAMAKFYSSRTLKATWQNTIQEFQTVVMISPSRRAPHQLQYGCIMKQLVQLATDAANHNLWYQVEITFKANGVESGRASLRKI